MALRYAVANNNWSNTVTWNGGTLPASDDDVYLNGFGVTLDQDVDVLSIRTTAGAPASAGGQLIVDSAGRTITCTGAGLVCGQASTGVILMNTALCHTTYNGLTTAGNTTNFWAINITTLGVGSNLTIVGDVIGGTTPSSYAINNLGGSNTISITGNVIAGGSVCVRNTVAGTSVNVTGNVTGGTVLAAAGISVIGTSPVSVTGNCTAFNGPAILTTASTSPISCIGTITAANTYGINSLGTVTISSPCINSATNNAIASLSTRLYASSPITWTFKDELGANKILYSASVPLGNPALSDVREGITYGSNSELTGTLIVPSPSTVVSGVPTDDTVGTYTITTSEIAAAVIAEMDSNSTKLAGIKANTDLIPAII